MSTRHEWYLVGVLALAAIGSFFITSGPAQADGFLHVYFFDVGQGDATLIRAPDGTQVLIDGGPGRRVLENLAEVMPLTDRTLDAVVLTHTDADHITGLVSVLEQYDVAHIIETGMRCATAICAEWETATAAEEAVHSQVYAGYRLVMNGDIVLDIISPAANVRDVSVKKTNNAGIVVRMTYGTQSVLFTADVEAVVEQQLVDAKTMLDSDFLKIGHHGSKTSTTQEFLDAVTPLAAFIEVGAKNSYGHPTALVLDRLAQMSIPVYRTDVDGLVELVLDGTNYSIKKSK